MALKNTTTRWGAIHQGLHWVTLVLLLLLAWIGLRMGALPNGPDKIATYALHKSIGLCVLAIVLLRIGWRLFAGSPTPLTDSPHWQHRIAQLTHIALYVLLLAMPLSGWLLNSAAGFPLQWFGLFNLPALTGHNDALHALAVQTHETLFWTLVALVLLHAAAAFYHHLFMGDATLARMLPRGWLRAAQPETPDA